MSYVKTTDFLSKDTLSSGNPLKIVKGSELDTEFNAIATADALNLKKDGSATPTANIPMGNFKLTGLAIGSSAQDSARFDQLPSPTNILSTANGGTGNTTGTATINANLTGHITSVGNAAVLNSFTLAQLNTAVSDANLADLAGATFTGYINEARGSVAMHATTMDIWAQPNIIDGTGSAVTITAIANAPQAGSRRVLYPIAATVITNGATFAVDGAANYTTKDGDALEFEAITTSTYKVHVTKKDGMAVVNYVQIQPISASVAGNALTVGLNPTTLDFRSPTLTIGVPNTRIVGSALSLVVPAGATLGTVSAIQTQLILLAIDNAGTVELAIVNLAGGVNLDETTLISTTAISAAATSASVVYSTTARSNVPFRVVGFLDITETTAGTWATDATVKQGAGGQALAAMSSLGYGQTWQSVSRTSGTTYYNTTGRPIVVHAQFTGNTGTAIISLAPVVGGVSLPSFIQFMSGTTFNMSGAFVVPAGMSYSMTVGASSGTPSIVSVYELR